VPIPSAQNACLLASRRCGTVESPAFCQLLMVSAEYAGRGRQTRFRAPIACQAKMTLRVSPLRRAQLLTVYSLHALGSDVATRRSGCSVCWCPIAAGNACRLWVTRTKVARFASVLPHWAETSESRPNHAERFVFDDCLPTDRELRMPGGYERLGSRTIVPVRIRAEQRPKEPSSP
jgi:hypothetical protein